VSVFCCVCVSFESLTFFFCKCSTHRYAENRLKNISQFTSYYVVTMLITSIMSLFLVVFGLLGATRRNLIGSHRRAAHEAVSPQIESIPVVLLLISISMKVGFATTLFISALAGYRDLETMDVIVFYFVVTVVLTTILEACLLLMLGSRYYLIRKMKRRFGYHPAPFEVIVPTALSYNQRKHMQQEPDHDTDEELSGLDETGSSSSCGSDNEHIDNDDDDDDDGELGRHKEKKKRGWFGLCKGRDGNDGGDENKKRDDEGKGWWNWWRKNKS